MFLAIKSPAAHRRWFLIRPNRIDQTSPRNWLCIPVVYVPVLDNSLLAYRREVAEVHALIDAVRLHAGGSWRRGIGPMGQGEVCVFETNVTCVNCGCSWSFVLIPAWIAYGSGPHYALYTNALASTRAGYFYPHDEFYDDGLREAIKYVCDQAPHGATIAHETPGVVRYYLERFERTDLISHPISRLILISQKLQGRFMLSRSEAEPTSKTATNSTTSDRIFRRSTKLRSMELARLKCLRIVSPRHYSPFGLAACCEDAAVPFRNRSPLMSGCALAKLR